MATLFVQVKPDQVLPEVVQFKADGRLTTVRLQHVLRNYYGVPVLGQDLGQGPFEVSDRYAGSSLGVATASTDWIGVDLDGTLAQYEKGSFREDPYAIGEHIVTMQNRVRYWLNCGAPVRILTARVAKEGQHPGIEMTKVRDAIEHWCQKHLGRVLPVTCEKSHGLIELWDDRARQVEANTGRTLDEAIADLQTQIQDKDRIISELRAKLA